MKNLKLILFLALGISLTACQKEIVEPTNIKKTSHNLDITFVINPTNDYTLPEYSNEEVAITIALTKYNTKTFKTEKIYDFVIPKTGLKNYKTVMEIKKTVKDIVNGDEIISWSYSTSYNSINNTNLRASAKFESLSDYATSETVRINL